MRKVSTVDSGMNSWQSKCLRVWEQPAGSRLPGRKITTDNAHTVRWDMLPRQSFRVAVQFPIGLRPHSNCTAKLPKPTFIRSGTGFSGRSTRHLPGLPSDCEKYHQGGRGRTESEAKYRNLGPVSQSSCGNTLGLRFLYKTSRDTSGDCRFVRVGFHASLDA